MRRQLSQQQIDALISRLKTLNIGPGIIATTLWQFGWLVPPYGLMPLRSLLLYLSWAWAVLVATNINIGFGPRYLPGSYLPAVLPLLPMLLIYGAKIKVRSRLRAILLAGFLCGLSLLVIGSALLLVLTPQVAAASDFAAWIRTSLLYPSYAVGFAFVLNLLLLFRRRHQRQATRWEQLVEEAIAVEAF